MDAPRPVLDAKTDPTGSPAAVLHHGLASMMLGALFILVAPMALQLAFWLESTGYKGFPEEDKRLAAIAGYVSVAVIVLLGVTGLCIGVRGIEAAGRSKETSVLPWCGVALNALSAVIWIGVGVAWHSQAWRFVN